MSMFESMKKYQVSADSVEDFCNRYHRRGAYHERGKDYMYYDLQSHKDEFKKQGYTMIPKGSSTTGDHVTYYGQK